MPQEYGFRASNNLSEVLDRDVCLDNLGINRRDLALLIGTSDAGVTEADYQAIIGLSGNLEQQVTTLTGYAGSQLSSIENKASATGDTFTGPLFSSIINNDRPYTTQAGTIIGPSTVSYFSPTASGDFATGAEYKLGPLTAATITTNNFNYGGLTAPWNNYFSRYTQYVQVQEQPSWTTRRIPLFLPPPTAISGCVMWLDAEFSEFSLDGSNGVIEWKGLDSGAVAVQSTVAARPVFTANVLNGKPAIRFDGSDDHLTMGNLGFLVPEAATLIIKARVLGSDYNIVGTLNNVSNRWNDGTGVGNFGLFTSAVQTGFPTRAEFNGTFTFTVRASNSYGLEVRKNSVRQDYKNSGFTYAGGDSYILGKSGGSTGFFQGDIYSIALFNRILSDKEARTIEEYFAWRYDGVYDPDRLQQLQLEDFATIDLENGTPLTA